MKMYITQLRGVFEQLSDLNDTGIEEIGRRLAQSIASEGSIYTHGIGAFQSIPQEVVDSTNALPNAKYWSEKREAPGVTSSLDTLLIFISKNKENEALALVEALKDSEMQVIGILQAVDETSEFLLTQLDAWLSLPEFGPLIPFNDTEKIGDPTGLALLFLYHLIYFATMDILDEQDLLN